MRKLLLLALLVLTLSGCKGQPEVYYSKDADQIRDSFSQQREQGGLPEREDDSDFQGVVTPFVPFS